MNDEELAGRLRDLSLVELDALGHELVPAFADDVADALKEARTRIAALRTVLGGPDPLLVLDLPSRQRASDPGQAGMPRVRERLTAQAEAARALARLAELSAQLTPKLFEADRRR